MGEVERPLDHLVRRLRTLGATDDEIAGLRDAWEVGDDGGWEIAPADLVRATDGVLRALLADVRREYTVGTLTEEEEAQRHYDAVLARVRGEAGYVVATYPVGDVIEWVRAGVPRAAYVEAVREAERERSKPRKSLLFRLDQIEQDG